jgi:hypothetical protein
VLEKLAVITCPALKEVSEGERGEGRIAARASTADDDAPQVHQSALGQVFGAVHAIVNIDDAPTEPETFAIFASEPSAPAVVDIEHGDAATGPELYPEVECARR